MTKTSRFRHRREKNEQRKVRAAAQPKPMTRTKDAEKPVSNPLISPLTAVDPVENSIFDGDSVLDKPKAPDLVLVKLSQGVRDELHTWKNTGGNTLTGSRTPAPATPKEQSQKRLRNSSSRKDVR